MYLSVKIHRYTTRLKPPDYPVAAQQTALISPTANRIIGAKLIAPIYLFSDSYKGMVITIAANSNLVRSE